jgi:TonB family protein
LKKWMFCFLCLWWGAAAGEEIELILEQEKAPSWPRSLYEAGTSGWVLARFSVHYDGSITGVKVIESSHPKFARSVDRVIPMWRFRPWAVTAETPAVIEVTHEYYFTHWRDGPDPIAWLRQRVRHLRCAKFNKSLATFNANPVGRQMPDMDVFRHTFSVIARRATHKKLTDERRYSVGETLTAAIPQIISHCEANPETRYRDALPEQVRELL